MLHTIENDLMVCTIESIGAEIRSLKDKTTNREYIWQIDESVWGSSSPVLFPAIGKIISDKVVLNGKEYAMSRHGIIRNNYHLAFQQHSGTKCSYTLLSSEDTLKKYPYNFLFTVQYELIGKRLVMTYEIENLGLEPMHFACGGHTAYSCPINRNVQLSDYVIEFPSEFDFLAGTLGESGLLSDSKRKIESEDGLLTLSETLFNEDALIFADINFDSVRLRRKNEDKGVVVRFKGYPNLAIWAKPGADYVCIEPWLGLPDSEGESNDITKKPSYKTIDPDTTFVIDIETEIE